MAEFFYHPANVFLQSEGLNSRQIGLITKVKLHKFPAFPPCFCYLYIFNFSIPQQYRGVTIECIHLEHSPRFKISRFTKETADRVMCKDEATGKEISIMTYFLKQHNYRLLYGTCLPCIIAKNGIYLPVEVCRIVERE